MRILTFGAFDILHYGHMRLLERAAQRGDYLIVGLASDTLIASRGKPEPFYSFDIRREMLLHTRHVDEVVLHDGPVDGAGRVKLITEKVRLIRDMKIDEIVMGSDWAGEYDVFAQHCAVHYLDRTPGISTSCIRKQL
ncbi:adenylyltransferase/cytidyltransferase family protein [Cucumibacter marinus]|uniref:adenylyltransferase/cytidyltransferase family protein n=1 Tax=Cucumibacter marinus TaxID=1121252 RepID=UPI000429E6A9|nr:adenylyltransferase/cytidyltransferase family protein [Cucumibacter marinus]